VHRTGFKSGPFRKLGVYVAFGFGAAALAGFLLGILGSALGDDARAVIATVIAVGAIVVAVLELLGRRVKLVQLDRETPRDWLARSPLGWAALNGTAIGIGAGTRLGVWLWYVVPLGALLSGDPVLGMIGYGAYGLTRTAGAGGIMLLQARYSDRPIWLRVLRESARARRIASAQLLFVASLTLLVLGT
jgi:hypothetical protein